MTTTLAIALLLAAPTIRRVGEAGVGLFLLVLPFLPLALLFGVSEITPELSIVARLNGAALLPLTSPAG